MQPRLDGRGVVEPGELRCHPTGQPVEALTESQRGAVNDRLDDIAPDQPSFHLVVGQPDPPFLLRCNRLPA